MKKICGIDNEIFWVCEFDEYSVITIHKITPIYVDGNFTPEVEHLFKKIGVIHNGTPLQAIHELKQEEEINAFLDNKKQEELINLFRKK
jgi:hypothetical protein